MSGAKEFDKKDKEIVKWMAVAGVTYEQIASRFDCSVKTLKKYCKKELNFGKAECNAAVVSRLYAKAIGGNVPSMIWWTKAQCGWSEKSRMEHDVNVRPVIEITPFAGQPKEAQDEDTDTDSAVH